MHRVAAPRARTPRLTSQDERSAMRRLLDGPLRTEDGVVARSGDHRTCPATSAALLALHVESLERGAIASEDVHEIRTDAAALAVVLVRGLDAHGVARTTGVGSVLDTALVGAALDGLARLDPALDPRDRSRRDGARAFVERCLREGRGQLGAPEAAARRSWTLGFAPHLLRVASFVGPGPVAPLIDRFVAGYWFDDWFLATRAGDRPVPRAHAHALEGLAVLRSAGIDVPRDVLRRGTTSLLGHCSARSTTATLARALRLGVLVGVEDTTLARVERLLSARRTPRGGLRESLRADSLEVALPSISALQARRWMHLGPSSKHLA